MSMEVRAWGGGRATTSQLGQPVLQASAGGGSSPILGLQLCFSGAGNGFRSSTCRQMLENKQPSCCEKAGVHSLSKQAGAWSWRLGFPTQTHGERYTLCKGVFPLWSRDNSTSTLKLESTKSVASFSFFNSLYFTGELLICRILYEDCQK